MFWGLIMEPQKRYTQVVKKAFHISMAALDLTTCTNEVVQVMCGYDNRKYLLCTLHKDTTYQCPLDLNFDIGTEVSFITNGNSHVHLSGYLVLEEEDMFDMEEESEEEENEADVSLGNVSASNIVAGKRSKSGKAEGQLNGLSAKINKKLTALSKNAPPAKKLKTMDLLQDINDEDDEDDSDVDLSDLLGDSDDDDEDTALDDVDVDDEEDDDDENEEGGEEEEDEDDDDDDEENDDDEEDESEDEEDQVFDIPPQNGTAKKSKKELAAEKKKAQQEQKSSPKSVVAQQGKSPQKKVEGGVMIEEMRVGSGPIAKPGKMVSVFYEGRFKTNNKLFDSSTKGNGFKFRLGRGEVIKGWDVGVNGMKVGGKRRIVCPPGMAYGAKGSPPTIPPNSTLMFEVELKNVN